MTLLELAIMLEVDLHVMARPRLGDWSVSLAGVEVKDDACLIGEFGYGGTLDEAAAMYAQNISHKMIVVDAATEKRREFAVPKVTHP